MKHGVVYVVVVAVIVAGVLMAATPLRHRVRELAGVLNIINADTGDVMASATYQRFQARREAIIAMRDDLRRFASAESAFIADSGHPTSVLPQAYGFRAAPSSIGPTIQIKRDRWIGTMTSARTTMMCQVTSLFDSVRERFGPAEVSCLGERAVDSAWALAQREAAAAPPPPPVPTTALQPNSPEWEPEAFPPAPRKHRDWGPVNNKPPRMPWIVKDQCPGEYCSLGRWVACTTVVALREKRSGSPPVFTLQRGDAFTALKGDVHVNVAGMVVFRTEYSNPGSEVPVDSIRFTPADTLYVLNSLSEGYLIWYYRGRADTGYQFWEGPPYGFDPDPNETTPLIREPEEVWWVRVRDAAQREGWVIYDFHRMARDDRMDESARCTLTPKR